MATNRQRQYHTFEDTATLTHGHAQNSGPVNRHAKPNRTTKISQKLKLFPDNDDARTVEENLFDVDVYTQLAQIPHDSARLEAERLNKLDRNSLSRVTAYCTASSYRMSEVLKYLKLKKKTNCTKPKRFDECLYTPYTFHPPPPPSIHNNNNNNHNAAVKILPEMFLFDYGVIVFWGMTLEEEAKILRELEPFEEEKLEINDVETEEFRYYYTEYQQPRIYNDIITLRHPSNYLVKLTISHAIAQSVKMTLFERLIDDTITETKYIPQVMAESGNIHMSRTAITKKIGQLFIMRINVNLVSNILDTPEIFWSEPALEPLYSAIRSYLEISQRVELLNQRVEVISDLLEMLKDHLNSSHGEHLEWIVIWLIAMEILVAVITTSLDAYHLYFNQ
ncbi:Putative Sporulation protein RMD1 [Rhizopus microsporus]|nr:Putative Sporulation protein RMD1 [Rhizopus microsporus]